MNARQLYLAWLRQTMPGVYTTALRKRAGQTRGLGGLKDDLVTRMYSTSDGFGFLGDDATDYTPTMDPITITADATPSPDLSSLVLTEDDLRPVSVETTGLPNIPVPTDATPAVAPGTTSAFAQIVSAVAGVAAATVNASSQSSLLRLNTQRAAQGLPPVNAQGVPITTGLSLSTNPTLARFESAVAGTASSPLLWVGLLAVAGFVLLRSKRA